MSTNPGKFIYVCVALAVIVVVYASGVQEIYAEKDKYLRSTNKRLWSIIYGKEPVKKSSFSAEEVRVSAPKKEHLEPPPPKKIYKQIPARHLKNLLEAPPDYKKFEKESRKTRSTSAKGRPEDFHEDPNAIKKFCEVRVTTAFCIRRYKSRYTYFGNTPRKHPRELDYSDKTTLKKKNESKEFVNNLMKSQNSQN
ncbi:MAG: hypothetical protein MAG581_01739 [Deltaproteobacteria bacterium]|nr:hypothetical protein [Deltaproteobacteria bacterium]